MFSVNKKQLLANMFNCQICSKVLKYKQGLLRHEEFFHKGQGYECPDCKKKFIHKAKLRDHITKVHIKNGEKS